MSKEYYSPKEVAEVLSVNRKHILRLIKGNQLPAFDVGTGQRNVYRISKRDLEEFTKRNHKENDQPRPPQN